MRVFNRIYLRWWEEKRRGLEDEQMKVKTFTAQMQRDAEEIFREYKGLIYMIARDILKDSALAEDCLQEVVMKLAALPDRLKSEQYRNPNAFVSIVAKNHALQMLKKHKREMPTEDFKLVEIMQSRNECRTDKYFVEKNGFTKDVNDCLSKLKKKEVDVIILREAYSMSYREIAKITCENVNTVEQRFHRAKNKLRELMLRDEEG